MAYTEIKERNGKKYFYRVISIREGSRVMKNRIYLGIDLNKESLGSMETGADKAFLEQRIRKNIEKIKPKIIKVLRKYKIKKAGLFGSYARGEQKKTSDIDIIIDPPKGIGLGFVGIAFELEDELGKKVDLLSYNGISPHFKKSILEDEIKII